MYVRKPIMGYYISAKKSEPLINKMDIFNGIPMMGRLILLHRQLLGKLGRKMNACVTYLKKSFYFFVLAMEDVPKD